VDGDGRLRLRRSVTYADAKRMLRDRGAHDATRRPRRRSAYFTPRPRAESAIVGGRAPSRRAPRLALEQPRRRAPLVAPSASFPGCGRALQRSRCLLRHLRAEVRADPRRSRGGSNSPAQNDLSACAPAWWKDTGELDVAATADGSSAGIGNRGASLFEVIPACSIPGTCGARGHY
jgi:hypothetical protein